MIALTNHDVSSLALVGAAATLGIVAMLLMMRANFQTGKKGSGHH